MSPYWKYFIKEGLGEICACRYCKSKISTKGGQTSGLKRHLIAKHRKMYEEEILTKETRKTVSDQCDKVFERTFLKPQKKQPTIQFAISQSVRLGE